MTIISLAADAGGSTPDMARSQQASGSSFIGGQLAGIGLLATACTTSAAPRDVPGGAAIDESDRNELSSILKSGPMGLISLCDLIANNQTLHRALVISTEAHLEHHSFGVTHRCLLLQLRTHNHQTIWLRLDRRRGVDILDLVKSLGVCPADDRARFSSRKSDLSRRSTRENLQVMGSFCTLGRLEFLLRIFHQLTPKYKVWPVNCWYLVSLVQEHLVHNFKASFEQGQLNHPRLAKHNRLKLRRRVREDPVVLEKIPISWIREGGTSSTPDLHAHDYNASETSGDTHKLHRELFLAGKGDLHAYLRAYGNYRQLQQIYNLV